MFVSKWLFVVHMFCNLYQHHLTHKYLFRLSFYHLLVVFLRTLLLCQQTSLFKSIFVIHLCLIITNKGVFKFFVVVEHNFCMKGVIMFCVDIGFNYILVMHVYSILTWMKNNFCLYTLKLSQCLHVNSWGLNLKNISIFKIQFPITSFRL